MNPSENADRSIGLPPALPFWLSLSLVPAVVWAAISGGWALVLPPLAAWGLFAVLDSFLGTDTHNADPLSTAKALFWHDLILRVWPPVQFATLFWLIWYQGQAEHLATGEKLSLFFGAGILSGTVGIVYAHELMHRHAKRDRWLADLLMASVLYSHFRSEHLLVHHVHVGTPRDAVTARYNEGFHRFFPRALLGTPRSAFVAEATRLQRAGKPAWHRSNPFWRYGVLSFAFAGLSIWLGGWAGFGLFAFQALVAVWQLELVNYVEHYGLSRQKMASGKYEPVQPHHSWNASQRASNWLLINLQRHSDHHAKPARPFPLLQSHGETVAPQLPYGYPVMTFVAMIPPLWRRMMNPRVRAWRRRHYPQVADWALDRNAA